LSQSVNYSGCECGNRSRSNGDARGFLRRTYRSLKRTVLHDTLLLPYGVRKHRALRRSVDRSQAATYTSFCRSPTQLEALLSPVLDYLDAGPPASKPLRILVFACSNGAEVYTLASALMRRYPGIDLHVDASDVSEEMVQKARSGLYTRDEVLDGDHVSDAFVDFTFDRSHEGFRVKPGITSRVTFSRADLLDPGLTDRFQTADIVVVQNVLFHLEPAAARTAFRRACGRLKERAALFVDGMDLDLKLELTRELGLTPLEYKCREIYRESRAHHPVAWWNYYYGAEPYLVLRRDRVRRYSTIFLR
jgi:chemotaxis protein methyltransferase CheR